MDRHDAEPRVGTLPGPRATAWRDHHHQFAAPSTYVYEFVWDVTAPAEGPFCTDVDGNVLLDFTSHVASAPLGYNNPMIVERLEEFDLVDPMKIAGQDFYVGTGWPPEDPDFPGPTQLMDRLVDCTSHLDLDTVFLSNSGAEAIENAIKICYDDRDADHGVTFEGAFHGRTLGALSLNRSKPVHRKGYPAVPNVLSFPYCTCRDGECTCGWRTDGPGGNVLADKLHPERGNLRPADVAYLVFEPLQGEGGYRVPSDDFVEDLADLRDRYGIPIISDEIQAGIGRTGEFWGVDHLPVTPDVVTCAKGLRVGATVATSERFPDETGRISSTWGAGDVLGALQGALTLEAIEEHDLLAHVTEQGRNLRERLVDADLDAVCDVRGRGLMIAVEFDTSERRNAVVDAAFARGLLTLGCGTRSLRLLPPLDVTDREIEMGVDLLADAVAGTA